MVSLRTHISTWKKTLDPAAPSPASWCCGPPGWGWLRCTENRVEVWGAWSDRRYSPGAVTGRRLQGRAAAEGKLRWQTALGGVTLCLVLFNDTSAGLLGAFSGILWNSCEFAWGTYRGEFSKILMSEGITHPRISENVLWLHKWPPISFWLRLLGITLLGFQVTGVGGGHCHRQWSN